MHTDHLKAVLSNAYNAFNKRNITGALQNMHLDVSWPNGMEGGTVHGHDGKITYSTQRR